MAGFFVQRARGDYDYASLEEYLLDQMPDGGNLSGVTGERSVGRATASPSASCSTRDISTMTSGFAPT